MTLQSPGLRFGFLFAHSKYRKIFNIYFPLSPELLALGCCLMRGLFSDSVLETLAVTTASCCGIAPASEI